MTTCSSSGGARRVFRRRFAVCSLRSRTSRQNSHINLPLCNPLSLRPKIVSPALSQHHEGRQFKSDLCNQLFFPVKRVPGTLQPSEFVGEFVQADGWARLPVTPLNPGSVKLRRTFLMSRSPNGISRF